MAEIRMQKLSDGMIEGTVLRWLKREGEEVREDDAVAEIETDKANVEMTAEASGKLTKIVVAEGQTVPVGTVLAYVGEAPAEAGGAPARAEEPSGAKPTVAPREEQTPARESAGPEAERVKASPLARKMAREMGIDLALVAGTGPGGRIVERDILAVKEKGVPAQPAVARPPVAAAAAPTLEGRDEPVTRMRQAIARVTVQSKQTIPHFYLTMPVEMDRALDLLKEINGPNPEHKITVNDLVLKASAAALQKFPEVNTSWVDEGPHVRYYDQINIGNAVGSADGLRFVVINNCASKTLRQISRESRELADKARAGAITPQEMSGATFSISNMGMFGVEEFSAIISPPQSAILAVGAAVPEVVVNEDGSFSPRRRMRVTLSCDHRTVDGVLGARFLQEVKRLLENPLELLA